MAKQMEEWKRNSLKAAQELNWQKEKQVLTNVFIKL